MIPLTLKEISTQVNGELVGDSTEIMSINTDTRKNSHGALFIALRGENFDAHNFLKDAIEQGASALMVDHQYFDSDDSITPSIPCIVVSDTRLAMGDIARLICQKSSAKFVGITGSVGKTTVKEMLAVVLKRFGKTLATAGNFNNDIGVPLTVFRLEGDEEFAVIEMGANKRAEIAYTAGIVKPHVSLVNNVAGAHLEGFGDLQTIAREKGEIYLALREQGIAIINADDTFRDYWLARVSHEKKQFSMLNQADVYASDILLDDFGCATFNAHVGDSIVAIQLSIPGKHLVANALAIISICSALNLNLEIVAQGIAEFAGVDGRLKVSRFNQNCSIIDDTYNANFSSLKAAMEMVSHIQGIKIVALGDMSELGEQAREIHEQAGETARSLSIDYLLTVGELSKFANQAFGKGGVHFNSRNEMTEWLKKQLEETSGTVLLKGSRSARMEDVVHPLLDWAEIHYGRA